MGLKNVKNIKIEYITSMDNAVENFYIPCLKEATVYKRAVGFFSSELLIQLTKGIAYFAKNGGKMKLLVSPRLTKEDYDAIENGYNIRDLVVKKMEDSFSEINNLGENKNRLGLLSYMISSELLEVRIAVMKADSDRGIYHEKLGIMKDSNDDCIVFSGSANETFSAFNLNYESIDVYCSWNSEDAENRCLMKESRFDRLWDGTERGTVSIPFPEVIKNKILKYNPKSENEKNDVFEVDKVYFEENKKKIYEFNIPTPQLSFLEKLRDYQKLAIEEWKKRGYRGIFDMATGTGKTYTGMGAITSLYYDKKRLFVCICVPYLHLADQWYDELKECGIEAVRCYSGSNYHKEVERLVRKFKRRRTNFGCILCVNKTFTNVFIQNQINEIFGETLLLVDEAHNFGADSLRKHLDLNFPYRLALSATLDRQGDEEGTQALYDFFGEKCFSYSLEKAIQNKMLTGYKYYPVLVTLTEEELEKYVNLTSKIGKMVNSKHIDSNGLKTLLLKRARLIAGAENKINVLVKLLKNYKEKYNMLIYCGAVKYGEPGYDDDIQGEKQIDLVRLQLRKLGITATRFTSQESKEQRKEILDAFKSNVSQALVAIKCLDEGVNVPAISTAFILASSTNPKEYIQRRGRVLRKYPGKEYAEIYDFVTIPFDLDDTSSISQKKLRIGKKLVERELERVEDFAKLANNPADCNDIIFKIKELYDLNLIMEEEYE